MIYLITGQPGAGKTLFALSFVMSDEAFRDREIYYNGIPDLKLPWVQLDSAEDWHKLPAGSVVVIDEAQRVFRPRGNGATVPEHVAKLETHRHSGVDLVIITQHPMLIDSNVRRLCGQHRHVVRPFGMARATVHQWGEVKEQCDKSRGDSIKTQFSYPREAFGWYKSAEVHTHKRRIPGRVWFLLGLPFAIGAVGYAAYAVMAKKAAPPVDAATMARQSQGVGPASSGRLSKEAYIAQFQPRVDGLAYTAPAYDSVTTPTDAPFPVGCMATSKRCICISQQGTRLDMPDTTCRTVLANGIFKPWGNPRGEQHREAPKDRAQVRPQLAAMVEPSR